MIPATPQPGGNQPGTPEGAKVPPEPIAAKRERFLRELRRVDLPPVGDPERRNALRRFQRFCRGHVRELKDAGYTINTVKTALTDYRNAVKERLDGDELKFTLRYFTLTRDEWWTLRREYEEKVTAEAANTRPIDGAKVLETARANLNASAYTRQAAALMLLTGRRSIEVLKVGSVQPVAGRADVVLFKGQAKTKEIEVPPYEIPVLAPADQIIAAWSALRTKKDFTSITPDQVNAKCAKSLNEAVESMFGTCASGQKIKPKDLRAVYALICCETLKPVEASRTVYLATILGHRLYDQDPAQKGPQEGMLNRSIADSYEDFHLVAPLTRTAGAREETEIDSELVGEGADEEEEPDGAPKHTPHL